MGTFIDLHLVNMSKSIYDPLKELRLGTFTNINKKVKVKVKGREVQFSSHSEIFGMYDCADCTIKICRFARNL